MNELHLFAGAGGGILGGMLLGHTCVCAVEIEPYARQVLLARQRDKILPPFPIWDDVQTFDGQPWRGKVDIVCGGFPCQDISVAGNGKGLEGERSGLWGEMARIIGEVRPKFVFVENSPALTFRGLGRVLADLSRLGFDAKWGVVGAYHAGAPHQRKRIWILAYPREIGWQRGCGDWQSRRVLHYRNWYASKNKRERNRWFSWIIENGRTDADPELCRWQEPGRQSESKRFEQAGESQWETIKPPLFRVDDGMANWMDRHFAIGNGQVPAVVKLAFETLK